jgi:hypothetical protein
LKRAINVERVRKSWLKAMDLVKGPIWVQSQGPMVFKALADL